MTPKTGGTTCSVLRVGGFLVTDDTIFQVGDIILRAAEHLGQKLQQLTDVVWDTGSVSSTYARPAHPRPR